MDQDNTNKTPPEAGPISDDTEGHSLLLDTDYSIQRKPRDPEGERAARERRQLKETRSNRPERRQ